MNRRGAEEFFYFSPSVQIHRRREDINVIPEFLDSSFSPQSVLVLLIYTVALAVDDSVNIRMVIFIFARIKMAIFMVEN